MYGGAGIGASAAPRDRVVVDAGERLDAQLEGAAVGRGEHDRHDAGLVAEAGVKLRSGRNAPRPGRSRPCTAGSSVSARSATSMRTHSTSPVADALRLPHAGSAATSASASERRHERGATFRRVREDVEAATCDGPLGERPAASCAQRRRRSSNDGAEDDERDRRAARARRVRAHDVAAVVALLARQPDEHDIALAPTLSSAR